MRPASARAPRSAPGSPVVDGPPPGWLAPLDGRVAAPLLSLAARAGHPRSLAPDVRLFAAGDPARGLHLVVSGRVRVLRAVDGRATVVHQEGPGGLLGEVALFGTGAYPATAETTEPSVLAFLDAQAVHRALATDPALAPLLLRRLALRTGEVIARLDRVAHLTVPARVAAHLLGRVEARPSRAAPDEAVSLGMTLVRLADELGTVKALVVRALAALRRARVIEAVGAGRYRVLDLPALRRIAGGGVR